MGAAGSGCGQPRVMIAAAQIGARPKDRDRPRKCNAPSPKGVHVLAGCHDGDGPNKLWPECAEWCTLEHWEHDTQCERVGRRTYRARIARCACRRPATTPRPNTAVQVHHLQLRVPRVALHAHCVQQQVRARFRASRAAAKPTQSTPAQAARARKQQHARSTGNRGSKRACRVAQFPTNVLFVLRPLFARSNA